MSWSCFSISSATVAELIPGGFGHSKVVLLAFFCYGLFFYHVVVGLKAELGQSLHWLRCTAAQTVVLAKKAAVPRDGALLELVLSSEIKLWG